MYKLRIALTYTSNGNANSATSSINAVIAAWSSPVIAARATRSGSTVTLEIDDLTEAEAITLRDALNSAWGQSARSGGRVSVALRAE